MGDLIRHLAVAAFVLAGVLPLPAQGAESFDPAVVVAASEAAVGGLVGDYTLVDRHGAPLPLAALRGEPLVVSIVYTSCASVCPPTTQRIIEAVEEARRVFGAQQFSVLTLGFDARNDTPSRLDAFAKMQRIPEADWRIASADAATLRRLLADLGFSYRAAAGGFEHITQTTILDAGGRVYRQVYGDDFPIQMLLEPLKELIYGTSLRGITREGLIDRIKFICTTYNPATGVYEFDYAIGFGIVLGGLSLILTGIVILRLWLGNRRLTARGRSRA
ncbi:SCO family protein [Aurantimonas marianensis]|uniref:SCO family protein n=1 Tax=Aurantimonas marianensis TaxID=2920428 RepID=A0A9X2HFW9_9HYPH|nr:SCO family protein [Aurantimonas marianensis]MCP3056279.1 SCO family protein [Aurantimonas marianensis]